MFNCSISTFDSTIARSKVSNTCSICPLLFGWTKCCEAHLRLCGNNSKHEKGIFCRLSWKVIFLTAKLFVELLPIRSNSISHYLQLLERNGVTFIIYWRNLSTWKWKVNYVFTCTARWKFFSRKLVVELDLPNANPTTSCL